jgi:putative FmdB family regulatory protein
MPVYEYQCGACAHAFEEWQKINDPKITVCPKCGKEAVERLISQTAFMLKGGGWYKDLYASPKAGGDASSSASASSSTKSETKSDSSSSASTSSSTSSSGASSSTTSASSGSSSSGSSSGSSAAK